ncbi:MAG: thiamine phosphate synthase [Candidatus Methylacidiphilales bacterium]|nr:thiamine phosphate synthase [Candidatus Methylacidiphilales bacterium]
MNPLQERLRKARFYGILDLAYTGDRDPAELTRQMLLGGVEIVQLRGKKASPEQLLEIGCAVLPVCRQLGGIFIVNDHLKIAAELDADGVHVGQDDDAVALARAIVGSGKIVGKSTHSVGQAVNSAAEAPDYIGVGPLYATLTKPDYVPVGLSLIEQVKARVQIPQFCIGGVNARTLPAVLDSGAERIVIVSAILQAPDVQAYCRDIRNTLDARFASTPMTGDVPGAKAR